MPQKRRKIIQIEKTQDNKLKYTTLRSRKLLRKGFLQEDETDKTCDIFQHLERIFRQL